jgi:cyclophilin family peptidyl-prolyl cis-trans isomerase/DnaJ-domain-containing protein 1
MKHYEQLAEGYTLERDLLTAALRAFTADPERNEDLKEFLLQIASLLVQAECYEDGLNVCQMLRDNDVDEDVVLQNTAEAAFACSEFEIAEQCMRAIVRRHGEMAENSRRLDVIDRYKEEWAREEQLREAERLANDLPRVLLVTALGEIELELFEHEAPNTVANFITLVEQQFYDGLVFHEVKPRFAARAGCPLGDGSGSPGHLIRHECDNPERRVHFRGSLTTVSEGPVANGSQFYLTFAPTPELEGRSTVFGRVVRGLEVLAQLQRREATGLSAQVPPDPILLARVIRKGSHDYRPARIPDPTAKQREEGAKMMRKMLSR